MSDERRRHARVSIPPNVIVRVKFKTRRQVEQAYVKDISKGGIFLRTDKPLPTFSELAVVLDLPDGTSLEFRGRVVRAIGPDEATENTPAGMGVQFAAIPPEKRALLERFVDTCAVVAAAKPAPSDAAALLGRLLWIAGDAAALAAADYYQVLGVSPAADVEEIRGRIAAILAQLDPLRRPEWALGWNDERAAALTRTIREIEATLTDEECRAAYDEHRRRGG